jgi:hypothetical protein
MRLRAPYTGVGWLDGLCPPELRAHLAQAVELGSAVACTAAWWADAARGLITELEAGLAGRDLPRRGWRRAGPGREG